MPNEKEYPTLRFMRCKKCGTVFVANPDGSNECPECSSATTGTFDPDGDTEPNTGNKKP